MALSATSVEASILRAVSMLREDGIPEDCEIFYDEEWDPKKVHRIILAMHSTGLCNGALSRDSPSENWTMSVKHWPGCAERLVPYLYTLQFQSDLDITEDMYLHDFAVSYGFVLLQHKAMESIQARLQTWEAIHFHEEPGSLRSILDSLMPDCNIRFATMVAKRLVECGACAAESPRSEEVLKVVEEYPEFAVIVIRELAAHQR